MLIRSWLFIPFLLLFTICSFAQTMVPEFTANQTSGCAPLAVSFRDLTSGNPKFWNWDFGNGTLANVQNPVVVYSQPGTYTVTLVVRNADGTNGITKTNYITVNPSPSAALAANITTGCVPVTVQFADLSNPGGGSIISWQWDFGDGTTSNQQNPQKTYDKTGFYSVGLTVTSSTGCKSSTSRYRYIRIVSGVKAEFDFSKASSCRPPYNIGFKNNSAGPGNMSFQWDLGNGVTSTSPNPTATYATDGTYNVTLTATSEFGCSGTITKPLPLNGPTTSIIVPDSVCQTQKVFFRNGASVQPVKVAWNFGTGDVWPKTSSNMDDSTVYYTPGDYTVKLINTYAGCVDSATKNIYVRRSPDIDFSVLNAQSCKSPLTVTFQDATPVDPIVDWKWNFGDGTTGVGSPVTHTYNSAGDYNVSVTFTDVKGCEGKISKPAVVQIKKPVVDIGNIPAGGCVPYTFTPKAIVDAIDGVASWQWDFGDGGTASGENVSHTYNSPGKYTVKLTVTTKDGCTETKTIPEAVLVGTPPNVSFTMSANDVCASASVQFTDQTTPAAQLNKWEWDFGDGSTSPDQNPQHIFQDTGTFTVILTAYNQGCPAKSVGQTVKVRPPIAKFEHKVACGGQQVTFTNKSIVDPALGVPTYQWDFGDGFTSTDENPVHTYATLSKYNVTLTVTNGICTSTITNTVNLVKETAQFTYSRNPACRNAPVTISSTNDPQNISAYVWTIDGVSKKGSKDTTVTFNSFGPHNVSLQITDVNGCPDTKNDVITVTGPTAAFAANSAGGCINTTVSFTDQTTGPNPLSKWTFDFGDGQSQSFTQAPFSHTYKDSGEYRVKLTVQDNIGCIDTITLADTIFISELRTWFYADYDTICPKSPVQFFDSSAGKGLTYQWQFGDGATSTLQNPTHIYGGTEAAYNVTLSIRDQGGCASSVTRNRFITTISPKPAFDIQDTTTICPPIETKFTFRGADYDSLYWDFGDGFTSTLLNPTHFYNSYGHFEAKLYLVGYGGCLDSTSKMVHVYEPGSNTTWSYSPTYACNELTVDFSITTPPNTIFTFFFGDGTYDDTSQATQFRHYYGSPAFYTPSLLLYDAQECQVAVGGPAQIKVIGADPFFGVDRKKFCDSGVVYFTDYTIGNDPVVTNVWNFGDGSATTSDKDPVHYYEDPGLYLVTHTATTQAGCTKTVTDSIKVYRTPDPIIGGDSIACINEPFNFKGLLAVPDTAIAWVWTMGNGSSLTSQNISLTFADKGNYTLYLKATNLLGCTDTTSKNIFVPPIPDITILENPVIPVSTGVTLPVAYGEDIATYRWTPDKNLSCTDCPTPYANPKFTTTYNIKVTDVYGCTNKKDLTVTVVCNGLNYWLPNTFSPNNDGVNDVFAPRGVGLTRINSLKIFNRWGELVFEKMNFLANDRSPTGGWDGTYKGKPAPPDVYVYIIEFVCENAAIVPVKGNVALIR